MARMKATHILVQENFLEARTPRRKRDMPKWIEFCRRFMQAGFKVYLYEARKTVSKYITVKHDDKAFKVRFSDHAPNYDKEVEGDCDFFVGRTNLDTTNTAQAIRATFNHFGLQNRPSAHVNKIQETN